MSLYADCCSSKGCAAEKEQEKKNAEGLIRESLCAHLMTYMETNLPN